MSLGDDPIQIMQRLRLTMGELDRAAIDLRRLELGSTPEVRFAVAPTKRCLEDAAGAVENLLSVFEKTEEYSRARDRALEEKIRNS